MEYNGNIIIYDFEVFRFDTLLGTIIINKENKQYFQTWDLEEIKKFYLDNIDALWVGHNNQFYDNLILEAVVKGQNPYQVSKNLIENENARPKLSIPLVYLDLMRMIDEMYSLKMTEAAFGKDISETEVDFDIDRKLTEEEKLSTESYNRDDLNQTLENFLSLQDQIQTRFDLLKEFHLSTSHLNDSKGRLAGICLGAKKIWGIENMREAPRVYPDLRLNNKELLNYYLNEKYLTDERIDINICGATIRGGSGGMHAALPHYHTDKALYFDVSGFYNLTMINKGLLPRTLNDKAKQIYDYLYHEQLKLKKTDPRKRKVYKIVLLAVFGAQINKYTDFYDPYHGNLVMITGQLYLIDLLEKLERKIQLIQANTDGIIVKVLEGYTNEEVIKIVEEWENRTGYTIKKIPITDIWQRDVNCYMYREDGKIEVIGENAVYEQWEDVFTRKTWKLKEPPILAYCVVDYFMNGITPEETIQKYKNKLRMFQYICKKGSYQYLEIHKDYEDGKLEIEKTQKVNRAFASKNKEYKEMLYKVKTDKNGELRKAKVSNLPDNILIYNKDINNEEAIEQLKDQIDWNYYVLRGYEKIMTFLPGDNENR